MESWQVVVAVFFVLLPLVLMLDFWGDERLTTRGRPIPREWSPQLPSRQPGSHEHPPRNDSRRGPGEH